MKQLKQENNPFICTDKKSVANELRNLGYPLISEGTYGYLFYNIHICNFSEEQLKEKNIVYTNRLLL